MSTLEKLKNAHDRKALARLLGFQPKALTSIIYKTPLSLRYIEFEIPKKSGGKRTIKAPAPPLKKLQTHLASVLYNCLDEIEKDRTSKSVAYGFRRDVSITDNAKRHKRRRYVLNVDIEDFFPSMNFGRVRGLFLRDKAFELNEEVATTIAQIACDGTALPQGSPCSPVISELIGRMLDYRMLRLAKKHGVRYTRYADDLTFSTNQKTFPKELAVPDPKQSGQWVAGQALTNAIKKVGFSLNAEKTRLHVRGSRQMVNGLVVNEKANIKSEYYKNTRAMCDSLFISGQYHIDKIAPKTSGSAKPILTDNLNRLEGRLSHIYMVTQSEDKRNKKEQRSEPRAIRKLYRRFLFYKKCIALSQPLIITEGKTDPIYLRAAIRSREKHFPLLGRTVGGDFRYRVSFHNYENQSSGILDLGGGSSDLKSIVIDYLQNLAPYKDKRKAMKNTPMEHPVILVLDNDDGLKTIAATLKTNFGTTISTKTKKNYYHIAANLYVVKTDDAAGDSCIEDYFPTKVKNEKLDGKTLSLAAKFDTTKEYGKEFFAKYVVAKNADTIDFSGFDHLLDRVQKVLRHYKRYGPKSF